VKRNILATNSTNHFYNNGIRGQVINDQQYYGVTSILGNTRKNISLKAWQDRVGKEEADRICKEATTFGNSVHKYIENYLLQDIPVPDCINGNCDITKGIKLVLSQIQEINLIEYTLANQKYGYCGTCDALGIIGGNMTLIDWKTSKTIKDAKYLEDYRLQASAYDKAIQETFGIEVKEARIFLFLKNEKSFQQVRITRKELDQLFTQFELRLAMFKNNLTIKNKRKWQLV
jgi:hypothetical protein